MSVARQVSLPDLISGKKRNTAMSLSEGFHAFSRKPALEMTAAGFTPYTGGADDSGSKSALAKLFPVYYRTRQFVLTCEKSGHRIPKKLQSDMKNQEQLITSHLRALHPLFFQRFDELQLDRLLRAMPFMRLSAGRYIFGGENDADWNQSCGEEAVFLLLSGRVTLYPEPAGKGHPTSIQEGAIFGERRFRLGEEGMRDSVAASAKAEEPSMVGMLGAQVIETAFADRAFGNKRIAQLIENIPALARVCKPEKKHKTLEQRQQEAEDERRRKAEGGKVAPKEPEKTSDAILAALGDLSKIATTVHVSTGQQVQSSESLDENLLVVSRGSLEVLADVTLTERLDTIPPKRIRINCHIEKAEKLSGESFFDKLDPYLIVKMGDFKRFQTPVMNNAGVNPKFDYGGVLTYNGEEEMEFIVMDHDRFSADDLCGSGFLRVADLPDGWTGKVELTRPKRGVYKSESTHEEPAGKVSLSIKWDFEPVSAARMKPKNKTFPDQVICELGQNGCWGQETLMLGARDFRRTLEQAAHGMKYELTLGEFKVLGASPKGIAEVCTAWKVGRQRFNDFVSKCGRQKQFRQACRVSSLEKQQHLHDHIKRLVDKWEQEEVMTKMSKTMAGLDAEEKEEVMDPSRFRVAYRDCKARITVRNALNLCGGSFFDKLDPYALVRFKGSKQNPFKTSVLEDAGSDPFWACEGCRHKGALLYNGETAMEVSVWDYDKYSNDDLVATGSIQVEQFCTGFEGAIPLNLPEGKKRKANQKQMMIVIGVQWDPPKQELVPLDKKNTTITSGYGMPMKKLANTV